MTTDANTMFGLLAGAVGVFDLISVYLRGAAMPPKIRTMRLCGAALMVLVSAVILTRLVKLG